jgi:hypothetical protein
MGRAHIDTLRKPKSVTFQERVEISMNQGNGTDSGIKKVSHGIIRNKNEMTTRTKERDRTQSRACAQAENTMTIGQTQIMVE